MREILLTAIQNTTIGGEKLKNSSRGFRIYFIVIALMIVGMYAFSIFSTKDSDYKYNDFITDLKAGNVSEVTIRQNNEVPSGSIVVVLSKDKSRKVVYVTDVNKVISDIDEIDTDVKPTVTDVAGDNSLMISIIQVLLMAGVVIVIIMVMNGSANAGNAKMANFGKSRARLVLDVKNINFSNVAGLIEEKEELEEIVDFLRNPKKYIDLGARIPKGVLLEGPPGTGKTLLAKAVAGEAKVPFFTISGSDFVEMFVGVGASRVRDLFAEAKKNAPCIIFIDEIDSIGKSRDSKYGGGNDEREQTLNALLAEMDGFDSSKGILILAATNRPEVLDPALLRPGRFDRRVIVDTPDLQGRLETLKVHSKDVKMDETVNLEEIALATSGAVGSDLANMINEAAINAVKAGRKAISQADLFEAVEVVIAGKEKKNKILGAEEKKIVAYHEVGHALVTAIEKDAEPVQKITIVPRTMGSLGYVMTVPEEEKYLMSQSELEARLVMLLAGRAAEEIVFDSVTTGASNDMEKATKIAKSMIAMYGMSEKFGLMSLEQVENQYLGRSTSLNCSEKTASQIEEEIKILLKEKYEEAKRILTENRDKLDKIAEYLYEKETITGKQFMEIYHQCQAEEAGQQDAGETVEQQNDDNADSQVTDDNQ